MRLFLYSDESGVFDRYHYDYFVFGGLVFLSGNDREICARRYSAAEKNIRKSEDIDDDSEVKGCHLKPKSKNKLYRNLKGVERFGAVICQRKLDYDALYANKKTKQRYLDWAYTMAVRDKFEKMIGKGVLHPEKVDAIEFMVDEHNTATDGRYELRETLEEEFKIGRSNFEDLIFLEPLFPNLRSVEVKYCNSKKKTLIRAADIVANQIYYQITHNDGVYPDEEKLNLYYHP